MKFSPYKNPDAKDIEWDLLEDDEYFYDSDDSEDLEYPVYTSSSTQWQNFDAATNGVITDALETKTVQVSKLNSLIKLWSANQDDKTTRAAEKELREVTSFLDGLKLENQAEDEARRLAVTKKNDEVASAVRALVAEEERKALRLKAEAEAAEKERLRKIAAQKEAQEKRDAEEKAKRDREEQLKQKLEAEELQAQQAKSKADSEKSEAAAQQAAVAEQRKKLLGNTPEEDATVWKRKLETFKIEVLKPVSESKDLKNFCHRARLKINPRVGQVTNSIDQIGQVSRGLITLFDEAATKDPQNLAQRWCLNFFCKAIVKQAEGEVMVKPTACYPLAFLAISMMKGYPELKDLYLARIAKKCPWTIPFVDYDKGTESGRKSLGWKRNAEGKYEDTTNYLERQEGIFRLWAATASLKLKESPFPIDNSWKFISRSLNASSITDGELRNVAFAIVASFMEVVGKRFLETYGNQGVQIIRAIATWVGPDVRGANATRLRITVEEYLTKGKIGLEFEFER